ncbi:MAG: UPF0223 family protein [Apilactobacillus sp.]|uniref:UPF0223 family protein n=1 Tax=Apilactobacillus apinorum TaxID=1218495 RepID=UPI0030E9E82F|nr:UPF0223 family protein [Apilactobacillus sp.]
MNNYSYPIFEDWSKEELMTMMQLYNSVEEAYENPNGSNAKNIVDLYKKFQIINPAKMEQKQIDRDFANISGYSLFKTFKAAQSVKKNNVKMD